jgi:hypothetical protein
MDVQEEKNLETHEKISGLLVRRLAQAWAVRWRLTWLWTTQTRSDSSAFPSFLLVSRLGFISFLTVPPAFNL